MTSDVAGTPRTTITSGQVSGLAIRTGSGPVSAFLGLPFGALGPGRARFEPSRPPDPWAGVRVCTQHGPAVAQNPDPFAAKAGLPPRPFDAEAGLNLNVWTPATDAAARPVLIWVHGGANIGGSNADPVQDGATLAAAGELVVVSVNYRLGAFGFLWLEAAAGAEPGAGAPSPIGNAAIHDLLAALRWVQNEIAAFGGDPANVTVAGQSAGAALVGTLLGVPSAAGLFQRAIMQSGTAERVHQPGDAAALTRELLAHLGIAEADSVAALDRSTADILAAQAAIVEAHQRDEIGLSITYRPVVDETLIPAGPLDSVHAGVSSGIDLLIGTNRDEAAPFLAFGPPETGPGAFAALLERELGRDLGPEASVEEFKAAAVHDGVREASGAALLEAYLSDRSYRQPSNRLLDARAAAGGTGCSYSYLFTWPNPVFDGRLGACHGAELPFVFGTLGSTDASFFAGTNAPHSLSTAMIAAWSAFARTGDPTASVDWPRYELPERTTLIWNDPPQQAQDPRGELRAYFTLSSRAASPSLR